MRVEWFEIAGTGADCFDGQAVELSGWPSTASLAATATYLLLAPEPACRHGCLPTDPLACVEVFAPAGVPVQAGPLRLRGRWRRLQADTHGWRYQLADAVLAETGGVIGVWPPANLFPDLAALAAGTARMADGVGVAHVGLGTDMMGLTVPSALRGYEQLPQLAASLLDRFSPAETASVLGGNYARVAMECLH